MDKLPIKGSTIARTIVLFIALANQVMVTFGWSPIDIDEDSIYTLVSTVVTLVTAIWAWWENNSFTQAALKADEVLKKEQNSGTIDSVS